MSAWSRTAAPQDPPPTRELVISQKSLDSGNEIPTIPDADEIGETSKENTFKMTKLNLNQDMMYQEIDSELLKQNSFVALDGINLSPLLKFIHPDVNIKETDTVWTIDYLFKDLAEYFKEDASS